MILAKGDPVTLWEAISPFVALIVAVLLFVVVLFVGMCVHGMVKRDPWRCWPGHDWKPVDDWAEVWACSRCEKPAPVCRNCGHQHDPDAWVLCSVTRIGRR